ncbi:pre-mRNA 3'-end-processing factor FIP1 isoform X7 [Rattus norvegicus]|uniref:pre-mRNA 3'-end-processing factor FIP1 isoform X7 n=1 Tax=Rattus norvegicus TaxID=10116 RepID=UPI0003D0D71D|nr:pre-mRNA 3'-end-processing factor FIP1 isoform X8 [Rattus norvegicus]|eukprot:XP_006250948.1 PREDICTED: pre-mRNA 3'-end-processing factor FIP1 isoform X5 [Rattus norvegicus]
MSAGEVERLVELSGGTGGDEEEEWLYGGPWDVHVHSDLAKDLDENEVERPEEENASANPPSGIEEEAAENGVAKPKVTETEDDSDSDSDDDEDDVHVTIGDIKTGAPQYGSYGTAPVNLNIKAGGRVYGNTGTKVKGVDLDAPGSINGVPLLEVDLDSFEDKPWRKPGADLSDYFNYGFNEDTWKAYCEKQKRIRMGLEVIPVTSTTNKITAEDCTMEVTPGAEIQDGRFNLFKVQQGRTGNSEKEAALPSTKAEFTSPPSLFKTGLPPSRNSTSSQSQTSTASRKASSSVGKWQDRYGRAESPDLRRLPGAIDVIGQTITISRVEGRRRANENSNIQVLSDRSATEVDNNFSKPPPFFPPGAPPTHLPPPPFLPPPPTVSTAPPLIPPPGIPITVPPPGFPPPPGAPPPSLIPTIESGHSSGYDSRSARAFPYGNVMKSDTDTGSMQREAMSATELVGRKKSGTENDGTERRRKQDTSPLAVIVDVVMKVKKGTVTEDTSTKSLKGAKKEKRLAASRSLSRRARKLPLPSRRHLLCTSAPEIDAINLLIFLDNV